MARGGVWLGFELDFRLQPLLALETFNAPASALLPVSWSTRAPAFKRA